MFTLRPIPTSIRHLGLCMLALAACGGEPEQARIGSAQQASTAQTYSPSDTSEPQDDHYTYVGAPSLPGSDWLVVFLHGAGGVPYGYQTYLEHANALGFHVIGLSYWDTAYYQPGTPGMARIENICNGTTNDSLCWGEVRRAMFDGSSVPTVPSFVVPTGASMRERLEDLFSQLPNADWGQFKQTSGLPKWSKIVLAGHSMGAGNAAWIAQHRAVHRLVMMAQPQDYVDSGSGTIPADWIDDGFGTLTAAGMYGLAHNADTTAMFSRVWQNWGVFGMTSNHCIDPYCINVSCPLGGQYCGAHRLWSKAAVTDPHNDVAKDDARYGDAWTYMLTHGL